MESSLLLVSGGRCGDLYLDSCTGHLYSRRGFPGKFMCAVSSLFCLRLLGLDSRDGVAKEDALRVYQELKMLQECVGKYGNVKSCHVEFKSEKHEHHHPPLPRPFYEWAAFRWKCRLEIIRRQGEEVTDLQIVHSVYTNWERVFLGQEQAIVNEFNRMERLFLNGMDAVIRPDFVEKFIKNHTEARLDQFQKLLNTGGEGTFLSEPHFLNSRKCDDSSQLNHQKSPLLVTTDVNESFQVEPSCSSQTAKRPRLMSNVEAESSDYLDTQVYSNIKSNEDPSILADSKTEESLDESVGDCQELAPVKLEESLDNWTFLKKESSSALPDIKDGDVLLKDDMLVWSCLPRIHANSHFSTEIYLAAISIGMAAWDRGLLQGPDTADFTMGLSEALYKIGRNVNRTGQWPL